MIAQQDSHQVYSASGQVSLTLKDNKQTQSSSTIAKLIVTVSAYPNCLFVVVNQTGAIGSIIRGSIDIPIQGTNTFAQQDFDAQDYSIKQSKPNENKQYIYESKVLFGSTQIQFYELIMRRLLQLVFEQNKMRGEFNGEKSKVFLNIALNKAHSSEFSVNQKAYYDGIVEKLRELLPQVI